MILGYSFVNIIWYFLIYSMIGWCVEVVYCTVTNGKVVNRGFLNGPVCPIYGFGMVFVLLLLRFAGFVNLLKAPVLVLFFGGMILASSVELFAGWAMMKLFHARWWDYSMRPFNIGGYICLQFSLVWGLGAVAVIRICQIPLSHIVESPICTGLIGLIVMVIMCAIYALDFALTVASVLGMNKKLGQIEELGQKLHEISEELSDMIGNNALETDRKVNEGRVQAALAKAELELEIKQLENKRKELQRSFSRNAWFGIGRVMRAFPDLKHMDYEKELRELYKLHGNRKE